MRKGISNFVAVILIAVLLIAVLWAVFLFPKKKDNTIQGLPIQSTDAGILFEDD